MRRAAGLVPALLLLVSCSSDARESGVEASLEERIAEAIAAGDPGVALDCRNGLVQDAVWDFEGVGGASSPTEAASLILAEPMWSELGMPGGDRSPIHEAVFRVGRGAYLPVSVDGELRVLLAYDAQGPDVWSVSGGLWCGSTP